MTLRGEPLLRGYRELIHRNEEQHLRERQERGLDLLEQRDPGPFLPHVHPSNGTVQISSSSSSRNAPVALSRQRVVHPDDKRECDGFPAENNPGVQPIKACNKGSTTHGTAAANGGRSLQDRTESLIPGERTEPSATSQIAHPHNHPKRDETVPRSAARDDVDRAPTQPPQHERSSRATQRGSDGLRADLKNTERVQESPQACQDGMTKLSTGLVRSESGSLMLESRSQ